LAVIFFLAVWIDPRQPAVDETVGYVLLATYITLSAAVLALSWNNWWIDFRIAPAAHTLDCAVFIAAVYFTEGYRSTFTSPFFAFFLFLLFAATIRWGWKVTAATAAAVTICYFLTGIATQLGSPEFDLYRFGRRVCYLVVISLVLLWFGINQYRAVGRYPATVLDFPPDATTPPFGLALALAMEQTGARRAILMWSPKEEPWIEVLEADRSVTREERFDPKQLGISVEPTGTGEPFIFDLDRDRALSCTDGQRDLTVPASQLVSSELATRFSIRNGLGIPIRSQEYQAELFLVEIPGMCRDDLAVALGLRHEISSALDRFSVMSMAEEAAVARIRAAFARDLHDSVAQALAGACFRLEALRAWIKSGNDPEAEILAIKSALRLEQRQVRRLISKLRLGAVSLQITDLAADLAELAQEISSQWGVKIAVSTATGALQVPNWFRQEMHHLVREAAANAVRHGDACNITVSLEETEDLIHLEIADDGKGFGDKLIADRPWSINERVKSLGGSLSLRSRGSGALLMIQFPKELVT
jgi:signal transduction histidine kinase